MQNGGGATKGGLESGEGLSGTESEEGSEGDEQGITTQRLSWRQVVCSHQNTAKVVIVQPAVKGKAPAEAADAGKVSPSVLSRIFGD